LFKKGQSISRKGEHPEARYPEGVEHHEGGVEHHEGGVEHHEGGEGIRYIVKQGREWQEEVKKMEEEEMWKGLERGVEHPEGGNGWSLEREGYTVGWERTSRRDCCNQLTLVVWCIPITYSSLG